MIYLLYTDSFGLEAQAHFQARDAGRAREELAKLSPYRGKNIRVLRLYKDSAGVFQIQDTEEGD